MAPAEIGIRRRKPTSTKVVSSVQEIPEHGELETASPLLDPRSELQQEMVSYYQDLYALIKRCQKTLIFTNRRDKVERLAAELRSLLAKEQPGMDWFYVHHGSIAADLREVAETKMRDTSLRACTIATASLELGIDIGHLDLTVQVDAPHTVSSFVQRLGRSGRRGTPSRMCFYTFEQLENKKQLPAELEQVPWNFLQTIAIIQLYLEEQWIEPPDIPTMPLSLLYQQTMSILRARTELTPAQLAQAVLKLSPFNAITLEDYRLFLQHLVALDHLQLMDERTLIVGMKGERLSGYYHFYAIFASEQECRVLAGTQEVGIIQQLPEVGSIIGLAGYAWRVISVDERGRVVHVERSKGSVTPEWLSMGRLSYHGRMMQRVRQVLQEETIYPYLSPLARQRLALARELARRAEWLKSSVVPLDEGRFVLFPWTGSRIHRTLLHILAHLGWYNRDQTYYIEVVYGGTATALCAELHKLSSRVPELVEGKVKELKDAELWRGKHDYLTPRTLLEKAYINDVLDIPGTMCWLETCS
ncbi:helicase-related protein [Ktedonobacter sp. SOSP1-52]|uniref:helicase-related protein n=1 Tax=Ktedonobacter sp. SOSP1-52 TaxID=2778366 RepID=UPI001F306192|nr:helicase-related protein [Ktedonobacter sp. SOSP1-52]